MSGRSPWDDEKEYGAGAEEKLKGSRRINNSMTDGNKNG